ncbi:MAG: glycosyltransferase [Demequina sp.]
MTTRAIVVCSLEAWDDVWRRNQYLVRELLAADPELRVLFVEPPVDPLDAALRRYPVRRGSGLREIPGYGGRLHALEPTKWLPRALGGWADRALDRATARAVRRLGWDSAAVWINDPRRAGLVAMLKSPSIYDVTDDWVLAERGARESSLLSRTDAELCASATEVVVCSPRLQATKGGTLVPNGVDVDRYRAPAPRPADLPASPLAVYCGTLHEDRLDVSLVADLGAAMARQDGGLVLVGPNALPPDVAERVRRCPGVTVLGHRHRDLVPGYLQHADVLVVPHRVVPFTETLDPIKFYEYLAVGRPIVSTPVAGFRDSPAVTVVEPSEFAGAAAAVAAAGAATVRHEQVPDWSSRAADFGAVLDRATSRGDTS